jgi:tetratricopeptide (TPR) repeat protein
MNVKQSNKQAGGVAGPLVVLGLFAGVVLLFLFFYYGLRTGGAGNERNDRVGSDRASLEGAFIEAMNTGKNYLDQGRQGAPKAIEVFIEAVSLNSGNVDAALNLANAYLLNNQPEQALPAAERAIEINRQMAAGHYLRGCSLLRSGSFEEALKSLQIAKDLDHTVNAVSFQLGRAHQGLGQWEPAAEQFREVAQFNPDHGAVYYNLSQVLVRLGDEAGAEQALIKHQETAEKLGAMFTDPSVFESCVHTEVRIPFKLDQPELTGLKVTFVDATRDVLGDLVDQFEGPVGILDVGHDGQMDLFARNKSEGFQLLLQREGAFVPEGFPYPPLADATYTTCLVGDLQHKMSLMGGRQEDVLLLSDKGTQVFRVSPSGMLSDSSLFAQIANVVLDDGVLTDLDLTGKLDLVGLSATNRSLMFLRNQGNFSFINHTSTTNLPSNLEDIKQLVFDDWNGDDLLDLCLVHPDRAPSLFLRERRVGFVETNLFSALPISKAVVVGDLNNDLRADLIALADGQIAIKYQGEEALSIITSDTASVRKLQLVDYDNDGWLDIVGFGNGTLKAWRNRGLEGFVESTESLGLSGLELGDVGSLKVADLDGDCDTDFLLTLTDQSIKVLRNEGGNQNQQLKLRLEGNRSNPSALGVKIEITSGGLRIIRTVHELPIEIGLGKRKKVDAIAPHWSDLVTMTDFELEDCTTLSVPELELPTGSCPYLYVWDGQQYRFVTDLLGAAPLGLPVAAGKLIPADTDEFVWLGEGIKALEGDFVLQITEELREVLYLDEAKLIAIDHPEGVEMIPTNKLVPGPPFPQAGFLAAHSPYKLKSAIRSDGAEMRDALVAIDGKMASPVSLRAPQLRGLAEPFHIDLDFGEIAVDRPLVLAMNGWLRFGGGMANMGASHHPDLPFPFPVMSVELSDGSWKSVDVVVGAPAGKTKAMLVDLEGKLPEGSKRIRISMAFEIHWDRMALMEKYRGEDVVQFAMEPSTADLHWRGFSEYQELPWDQPLSPDYEQVKLKAPWLITPTGWCTRYGDVGELVRSKDDRLVLMNGGDELTLRFSQSQFPDVSLGLKRDYFFFTSGWDKDADPHVVQGWTVEPLPWHGMNDQLYGQESRPEGVASDWQERYNTRWVGQFTLQRPSSSKTGGRSLQ